MKQILQRPLLSALTALSLTMAPAANLMASDFWDGLICSVIGIISGGASGYVAGHIAGDNQGDDVKDELKPLIDANTAKGAANMVDIATNASDITALQISDGAQSVLIANNTTNIAGNAADIAAAESDITALQISDAAQGVLIANNITNIAANAADIVLNQGAITALQISDAAQSVLIASNTTNIMSNDTDIAALQAADIATNALVATNAADIASNDVDITALQAADAAAALLIAANDTDILDLMEEVNALTGKGVAGLLPDAAGAHGTSAAAVTVSGITVADATPDSVVFELVFIAPNGHVTGPIMFTNDAAAGNVAGSFRAPGTIDLPRIAGTHTVSVHVHPEAGGTPSNGGDPATLSMTLAGASVGAVAIAIPIGASITGGPFQSTFTVAAQ